MAGKKTNSVDTVLSSRRNIYGEFRDNAEVTQNLMHILSRKFIDINSGEAWDKIPDTQKVAMYMICHKLARIVCGDPNYTDNWLDIAGYATLVINELENKK